MGLLLATTSKGLIEMTLTFNYTPKREQAKAKDRLHQIWMASSKEEAIKA